MSDLLLESAAVCCPTEYLARTIHWTLDTDPCLLGSALERVSLRPAAGWTNKENWKHGRGRSNVTGGPIRNLDIAWQILLAISKINLNLSQNMKGTNFRRLQQLTINFDLCPGELELAAGTVSWCRTPDTGRELRQN